MSWKTKVDCHIAIAKAYMPLLHDENKMKHPKIYAFADKRWRNHMRKSIQLTKGHLAQMRGV